MSDAAAGWTHHSAGDSLADVPPVETAEDLQRLFETLADDHDEETADAFGNAAELVEAHRIHKTRSRLRSSPDKRATWATALALVAAFGGGALLPFPAIPVTPTLTAVAESFVTVFITPRYWAAMLLMVVAVMLSAYAQARVKWRWST